MQVLCLHSKMIQVLGKESSLDLLHQTVRQNRKRRRITFHKKYTRFKFPHNYVLNLSHRIFHKFHPENNPFLSRKLNLKKNPVPSIKVRNKARLSFLSHLSWQTINQAAQSQLKASKNLNPRLTVLSNLSQTIEKFQKIKTLSKSLVLLSYAAPKSRSPNQSRFRLFKYPNSFTLKRI